MNAFAAVLIAVFCAGADADPVRVSVAPDQPIPHVYVDDPLILELQSDKDATANISLDVSADYGAPPVSLMLGPIVLRARGTHWCPVEGAPTDRGRYRIHARVEADGAIHDTETTFCRVDRPVPDYTLPVCAGMKNPDGRLLLAATGVSVKCVHLPGTLPDLAQWIDQVASAGFHVVVALDGSSVESAESIAKTFRDRVGGWEIDPKNAPDTLMSISKALRRAGSKAPICLVVNDAQTVGAMLAAGVGQAINAVTYRAKWPQASSLAEVSSTAQRAGYEGLPLHMSILSDDVQDAGQGVKLSRQILLDVAANVCQTEVDGSLIFADGFGPGYVYLGALAHRLKGTKYIGDMDVGDGSTGLGFRNASGWMLALWSKKGAHELSLRLENAANLALYDARNNTLPAPELKDGAITMTVTEEPRFLAGAAGAPVAQLAKNTARASASAFVESESLKKALPAEIVEFVKKLSSSDLSGYKRLDFFNLLKIFPRIEEMWHTGALSRSVAVPALAALHRLARALCTIEQERGEAFVEPLQKTLDNCGQFQSVYLTSSAATPEVRERPDWLFDLVGRLMAEAEQLNAEGRTIEACAVATLAEWRARALEIAAKAQPLSQPEKETKPPETTAPSKEKKEEKPKATKGGTPGKQKQTGAKAAPKKGRK
jgi:hypothetical protein